jgi:hypothetical protein
MLTRGRGGNIKWRNELALSPVLSWGPRAAGLLLNAHTKMDLTNGAELV